MSFLFWHHSDKAFAWDARQAVTPEEFERFIGDQSIDFDHILADNKDVLKRLKQAEDE